MKKESLERALEKAVCALIKRQFGVEDTTPVLRSDQSPATDKFAGVIVTALRDDDDLVIDEGSYGKSTFVFSVEVELRSFIPAGKEDAADQNWRELELAMRSTDPTGIDLSRFTVFHVLPGSGSEKDPEEDGRQTRKRTFRVAVEEAV